MAMSKAEMWVQFALGAVSRYVVPDEVEDADELVDDMSDVAIKFADEMLDEFEERFDKPNEARRPRARKTKRAAEED